MRGPNSIAYIKSLRAALYDKVKDKTDEEPYDVIELSPIMVTETVQYIIDLIDKDIKEREE